MRNITLLIIAVLVFAGCGKGNVSVSSSASSEWTINGRRTISRTITRTHGGVTRKLETASDIDIQNGHVTRFAKSALVKIQETGGPEQRQAELRENSGKLELWIKDNGSFRKSSAEEESWLEHFLNDVTTK